jgi:hypothetical protein
MIEKITQLSQQIAKLPGTKVNLSSFPSGAAMLHVTRAERLFVLDYSPTRRFGVDEVHNDEGFLISYRFTSDNFEPAAAELWAVVRAAHQAAPDENGSPSGITGHTLDSTLTGSSEHRDATS